MRVTKPVLWCPYMVSMKQMVHSKLKICGGTVLSYTLTLTAAHCVIDLAGAMTSTRVPLGGSFRDLTLSNFTSTSIEKILLNYSGILGLNLQFGSTHLFFGETFQATKIIHHKDFNPTTLANDIGLVSIFPAKLEFGFNIQPVQLPFEDVKLDLNNLITIYGWGAVSAKEPFSKILLTTDLPMIDKGTCEKLLKPKIPDNTFCLGYLDGRVDACKGDSGGPAMLDGIQIGIISFGEGCAQPFKPGVYTDVRKYLFWLYKAIKTIP